MEDKTPVAESRVFDSSIEPMITSMQTVTPTRSDESSATGSPDDTSDSQNSPRKGKLTTENRRTRYETDKMSESYHEIFDTQMPPERAAVEFSEGHSEAEDALEREDRLAALCTDTEAATNYLTSKLVEDSLRWQREQLQNGKIPSWPPSGSPFDSPVRRRPQNLTFEHLNDSVKENLSLKDRPEMLDPTAILEIERHARYLATSVDSMIENLSGILHSISALTVDTLETYRDGVCKTCDEVDSNIKAMYQLMAKVEELNKSMAPAYRLSDQVKEVKRLLDLLESILNSK